MDITSSDPTTTHKAGIPWMPWDAGVDAGEGIKRETVLKGQERNESSQGSMERG